MTDEITFSFGQNWAEYVRQHYSEERVLQAMQHMLGFLEVPDLQETYFLDIGCGSGLHSLAASRAGARRIVSFDLDPLSVQTSERLRGESSSPDRWTVLRGSILDKAFLATILPADIVYSWGVLHHTGRMWEAVENAASLVNPGGVFYLALYTTTSKSGYWLATKQRYNRSSALGKRWLETKYLMRHMLLPSLARGRSPLRLIRESRSRGMDFMTDVRDWLGGLPYEDAWPEEVLRFGRKKLGMELINLKTGEACTEYLFQRYVR